jgi:hypothetical protein
VKLVVDRDPSTVWTTKEYFDPFGPNGLKTGVGLVLDLGSPQQIGSVTVRTVGATDFEVRAADEQGSALDDYTPVDDPVRNAVGRAVVVPPKELHARYRPGLAHLAAGRERALPRPDRRGHGPRLSPQVLRRA